MTSSEPTDDPFEIHFRREPRAGAEVDVLVFDAGRPERAGSIASNLVSLVRSRGREAGSLVLPSRCEAGLGAALFEAISATNRPLVLVTSAVEPWTSSHLDPLLKAIDACDHVVGRRPASGPARLTRRLGWLPLRLVFALPVLDPHSPCRLHRREALSAIPFQSESDFLDVEILAKATFLGHLIDEVPVPELAGDDEGRNRPLRRHDLAQLFRRPVLGFQSPIRKGAWNSESSPGDPGSGPPEDA